MFDFSGKVVMVTGASGNLGQAVATAFNDAGAQLVLVDHDTERLPQLFPDLAGLPEHVLATGVDVTDVEAVGSMVTAALAQLGRIDVLVNTVGGFRAGTPVHETPPETFDFMLALNARSVFVVCRAVIPAMLDQGAGKIISVAARPGGKRNMAAYSASKNAVIHLTESMAAELKAKSINVNCILPGTIDTPDNREAMPNADHAKWVPPAALADAILFLASDAARAVHGAALPVYGLS
jgi:NAD(P)-dependent dehydrogenase (short-subunit alcohol dehydrogenase family)